MIKNLTLLSVLLVTGSLLTSCTNSSPPADTSATTTTSSAPDTPAPDTPAPDTSSSSTADGSLSDPKGSIAYQLDLIKAGDLDKLKTCLTPRVRDGLTQEILDKAKADAEKYPIEELYDSAEMGEADGNKTAKVKMKNGRTLTTLVETDGKWLADTIWFK